MSKHKKRPDTKMSGWAKATVIFSGISAIASVAQAIVSIFKN